MSDKTQSMVVLGWGLSQTDRAMRHHAIVALNRDGAHHALCARSFSVADGFAWFRGADTVTWPRCYECADALGLPADGPYKPPPRSR